MNLTLAGKTILITRATHQSDEFVNLIKRNGGIPVLFPTIDILPPSSWEACDKVIDGLYMYDGIIFTSTNGVDFFFRRLDEKNISSIDITGKMVFVVGEKTRKAAEDYGLKITVMPEKFTAHDLANKLRLEDLKGKIFLFPKGNLAKDILPATLRLLGADVEEVVVYQTIQPNPENVQQLRNLLSAGKIDVITFTSPSTVKNFFNLIQKKQFQSDLRIAVIGPSTAKAIEGIGLDVDIQSKNSTIESLVEAIANYFHSEIQNLKSKFTS